jgi:hypothetical protein
VFPQVPDYAHVSEDFWIPGDNKRLRAGERYDFGHYNADIMMDFKGEEFLDRVESGKYRLWFHGAVRYRDFVSDSILITPFLMTCVIPSEGESWMYECSPDEYNRKT